MDFAAWGKTARLSSPVTITEKIDGTNAAVVISHEPFEGAFARYPLLDAVYPSEARYGWIGAQSRNRFITPDDDNYGFARWVAEHVRDLVLLGPGRHYGEWWGLGIQRGYGLSKKYFSLFQSHAKALPDCVDRVPVLASGDFTPELISYWEKELLTNGSVAAPGFMRPEGFIVHFKHNGVRFKHILDK